MPEDKPFYNKPRLGQVILGGTTGQVLKKLSDSDLDIGWQNESGGAEHDHDEDYAAIDHNHDGVYSPVAHNHDADYADIAHNHDADYSDITHNHNLANLAEKSYNSLTDKPTLGDAAAKDVGTGADEVAAGNHTHPGGSEAFPVGSVFIAVVSTDPATLLGYGTWSAFAAGKMLVGRDSGDTDFDTAEETGGAKTVTLTEAQIPSHTHIQDAHTHTQNSHNHTQDPHQHGMAEGTTDGSGSFMDRSNAAAATTAVTDNATATNQAATATNQNTTATNQNTGGGQAHNNMPPYIVVYMWKRVS